MIFCAYTTDNQNIILIQLFKFYLLSIHNLISDDANTKSNIFNFYLRHTKSSKPKTELKLSINVHNVKIYRIFICSQV